MVGELAADGVSVVEAGKMAPVGGRAGLLWRSQPRLLPSK
jgi:hypothetical protein